MALEHLSPRLKDCLQTLLQESGFTSDRKVSFGDIIASEISSSIKVFVTENDETLNLFIKFLSADDSKFSQESSIYFNNEIVFYGDILSQFKDLSVSRINKCLFCAPNCLKVGRTDGKLPFIIMEDLLSLGYTPLDVKQPLSVDCARHVFQQLGQFHAHSFAMKDQRPEIFAKATSILQETVFREDIRSTYGKVFIHSIHDVFKLAKQCFPPGSVYVEKFATFMLNIFERMCSLARGDSDGEDFRVVTHGDLWMNNILCKYTPGSSESPDSVVFVDFQGCRYASPVHDLMTVMFIGLDKISRDQYRHEMIRHYHMTLCQTLQNLGSDPLRLFPYSALQNQLLKHTEFALSVALVGLPLFLNEGLGPVTTGGKRNKTEALQEFLQEVRAKKSWRCKNKMLELITDAVDEGYI